MPKPPSFSAYSQETPGLKPANKPEESDIDRILQERGLPRFTPSSRNQFALYLNLLMKWNKAMNLVGARDWQTALLNLMADSFYLDQFIADLSLPPDPEIWDLGSGAGLPGATGLLNPVRSRPSLSIARQSLWWPIGKAS